MKAILNLVLILLLGVAYSFGQENNELKKKKDLKKIELRPNSRDYGPVKYDNQQRRVEKKRNKAVLQKNKMNLQHKKAALQKNKAKMRKDQIIKRRQTIIQQRRSLRK